MSATSPVRLSDEELEACRPVPGEGGRVLRAYCPFHGSDKQRSLRVSTDQGRFTCFACGAWGYVGPVQPPLPVARRVASPPPRVEQPVPRGDLADVLEGYRAALPGSLGERYLLWRGIPLDLARLLCVGYAACGQWAHTDPTTGRPLRQWKYGRLVFPHTDVQGRIVNLYGRAVGSDAVPKQLRHDHLAGPKGYFNALDLDSPNTPVYVCEGPFDALSLLAAGASRVVAIFGVGGWRWEWAERTSELIFAFDADQAGSRWRDLAWQAVLRGKKVSTLDPSTFEGCKDINEAWVKGSLRPLVGQTASQ